MTMTRPTTEQITHKGQLLSDVLDRPFNLLDFGAVGDGVTDDFDALIACANAVKAAGGGTLYIPYTPNGYYLRRGVACNLSNTTGISVISDGATLKLQGGTISQTSAIPVFFAEPATNITFRGLRFEAASTVLRYGNGGPTAATEFDVEAAAGRANINEQTTYRYCISIDGSSVNVTIDNCHFGTGIHCGIQCRRLSGPSNIKNASFTNLTFDGVNEQCILFSRIDNLLLHNIRCLNKQGCRFDWFLYPTAPHSCNSVRLSNVTMINSSHIPNYGSAGVQLTAGMKQAVMSNIHIQNVGNNPCIIGSITFADASENCTISNLVLKNCGSSVDPALDIWGVGTRNISIDNLIIDGCTWGMLVRNGSDLKINNFTIAGSSFKALEAGSGDWDLYMSNGTIVDSGLNTQAVVFPNEAGNRKLKMHNVRFEYKSFVPLEITACLNASSQAATRVELTNCGFVSAFGFATGKSCLSGTSDSLFIDNCWQTGFENLMNVTLPTASTRVAQTYPIPNVLAANSATPSVANAVSFTTANTTATAYTNFTGGVVGQQVSILVADANTTFDFSGTNLKGNNGVDYVATSGDVIFAKRIGSNWYCTVIEA
jgi:hypothetical protein